MIAVSKNANNYILPMAYAIVDEETNESWSWFFQQFHEHVRSSSMGKLCVISDRHKGIVNVMENFEDWREPSVADTPEEVAVEVSSVAPLQLRGRDLGLSRAPPCP